MILEWLRHLFVPCPRPVRDLGYLRELLAIEGRAARCAGRWRPHLENCRSLILEAAGECPGRGKVLVLGSGLLLDIPVAELSRIFAEVVLVDIFHLPAVRRKLSVFSNVRAVDADVTGTVEAVHGLVRSRGRAGGQGGLPRVAPDLFLQDGFDLVVSANILSQLPVLLLRRLDGLPGVGDEALEDFAAGLIREHLAWLFRFPGQVCLITDLKWQSVRLGGVLEEDDALLGVPVPATGRTWYWDVAPSPEHSADFDRRNLVLGVRDLRVGV